ncbi:MAG TPA: GDSL-type esterase/lipase family protein [Cytophaga sp.]|jgi:hypothetical protein|nr:GDSL-type esterase/lipase family protein [Cytophaga sp.]
MNVHILLKRIAACSIGFIAAFSIVTCTAGEVMTQKRKYFSFHDLSYVINGRYEIQKEYISFSSSGVSFMFMQYEGECIIWIEDMAQDTLNCNWMQVLVNDQPYSKLKLKPGKHAYHISASEHKGAYITLVKATEPFVGEIKFYGLDLKEAPSQAFDVAHSFSIQFIGNSITCGYGNMVSIKAPPAGNPLTGFHTENENAYESYAMQAVRNLNAVPMLVCFSGKGMYRNFDSDTVETIPKIYDRIHLQDKNSTTWDHTKQIPDIIVINLGTNDYYGESQNKPLNDSVFVQTYIQFVERLLGYYPEAKIVCVNGPMLRDEWPEGKKCWSRLQASIQKVEQHFKSKGNTNIYTFFFTPQSAPYGEDYHPSLATHTKMAQELTTFIQTVVVK